MKEEKFKPRKFHVRVVECIKLGRKHSYGPAINKTIDVTDAKILYDLLQGMKTYKDRNNKYRELLF